MTQPRLDPNAETEIENMVQGEQMKLKIEDLYNKMALRCETNNEEKAE